MEYPATREEAKRIGAKFYFTGEPCKHGHIALRKTKGVCTECERVDWRRQAETRAEYRKEYNARLETKERQHNWYLRHREEVAARAKTTPRERKREYQNRWKERNLDKVRADAKARRRKHRLATPPWLSSAQKKEIRELYRIAIHMTKITGEQYVVDHIFPLRSDTSCGLHVPWNLRVITQKENLEKGNRTPDERGYAFDPDWGKWAPSEGAA
jgi:5-methylcytosine-specific restriction endonuclease McrA